jgi:signal peptidase II
VRALLDAQRRGRPRRGASDPLRSLRGRPARATRVFFLAGAVVALDQITKFIALARLVLGVPISLVDNLLAFTLVMNPGLAFGLLGGLPKTWRWMVAMVSLVALIVLVRVALRVLPAGGRVGAVAIGLVFGGAVGNLIDRARFGAVVDFVDVHWHAWHWPAFNVADSAITVGVALLALCLVSERERPTAASG